MLFIQGIICCIFFLGGISYIAKEDGTDGDKVVGIGFIIASFVFGWWAFN